MDRGIVRGKLITTLVLALAMVSSLAAAEPVKMAGAARFDLSADARAGSIEDGQVIAGYGSIERMNWVAESDRPRGYTVNFPITYLGWRSLAVRFMPARSGTVTLTLMGPFEEASKGVIYRQEVVWDDVRTEGTALAHGGFEWARAGPATGWRSGGGSVIRQTSDVPAVEGTHYARTWHNQTLFTTFDVAAGRPVTIRLHARAVRINGSRDMKPIASRSTPAHLAAKRFQRGANLGNDLEVPPGQDWGGHYTPDDLRIAALAKDSITSGSRSVGIITQALDRNTASGRSFSPGSTCWSTPGCVRASVLLSTFTTSTTSRPIPRAKHPGSSRSGGRSPSTMPRRRRHWPSSS